MTTPNVWARWESRNSEGKILKFRIQDATEGQNEEILNFLVQYMATEENFQRACGVCTTEESRKEYKRSYSAAMQSCHIAICCLDGVSDSTSTILGISCMCIETPDEEVSLEAIANSIKTPENKKLFELISTLKDLYDPVKNIGVKKFYSGRGIVVHPAYRGHRIGSQFVETRQIISKAHGADATGAWMTSLGTQKAAERAGWTTELQLPFQQLGERLGVIFDQAPPLCKYMVARV